MPAIQSTTRVRTPASPATGYAFHRPFLAIAKGGKTENYTIAEFACGMDGRSFRLRKRSGGHYSCLVARNGQDNLCECRGFEAHGHCKHLDTLRAMLDAGELDEAGRRGKTPEELANEAGVPLPF